MYRYTRNTMHDTRRFRVPNSITSISENFKHEKFLENQSNSFNDPITVF